MVLSFGKDRFWLRRNSTLKIWTFLGKKKNTEIFFSVSPGQKKVIFLVPGAKISPGSYFIICFLLVPGVKNLLGSNFVDTSPQLIFIIAEGSQSVLYSYLQAPW
jgi:hypothetical protein